MGSPPPARPRLVDVAQAAGVSTATASLVLRGRPGPSGAARESVHAAAARLGYRPDRNASLLAARRTHLLGVLFDVSSPFHAELVTALDEAAGEHGLDLVLSTVTGRRDEAGAADLLLDFRCEGLVILGPTLKRSALVDLGGRCPTVVVGRSGTGPVTGVLASDRVGLELAVDHLARLGHRQIAYVDGPPGSIATARRRGYRQAMRHHGLDGEIDIVAGGVTESAGASTAHAVLGRPRRQRPTALIAYNDRCAIGARDVIMRHGIEIPEGLSIIGYDDSPPARLGTVDLTSISQDPVGLARATVATLARAFDGEAVAQGSSRHTDVVISPRLVIRGSTGPVSA